jgi:hypothetical protein
MTARQNLRRSGTGGSNPVPSSGESGCELDFLDHVGADVLGFLSNWDNAEFWMELERRFLRSANEKTMESARDQLHKQRNRNCGWRTLTLFKRLGVDVPLLSAREFNLVYYRLAKRYHPDHGNDAGRHELMANINAARTTILKASRQSN